MNRSNSSGTHSPMRRQQILLFENKSSTSLLTSPTKKSHVEFARHGNSNNGANQSSGGGRAASPKGNESEDLKTLRTVVAKYQLQLRMLEKETSEHRIKAKETNERANQLLKDYAAQIQAEDKKALRNNVNKYNLSQWMETIQLSAQNNTQLYTSIGTTLKSFSKTMRGIANGTFKRTKKHGEDLDDDIEPLDAETVGESVTKVEATTSSMLRLSKHIMSVAKKCIEERSFMMPKEELEKQMFE
jgi:hypothetical protein